MGVRFKIDDEDLKLVSKIYKAIPADLRRNLYAQARATVLPDFRNAFGKVVAGDKYGVPVLLNTSRVNVSQQYISITAATGTRSVLSGGFKPALHFAAVEFGATWRKARIRGRRGATVYNYEREINKPFRHRRRKGYFFYPFADKYVKRLANLWVESTVRTLRDAAEGKQ